MEPKLILATHNQNKVNEIIRILAGTLNREISELSELIVSAASLGLKEPIEDGATFEENAFIKANAIFSETGIPSLADDSGLIVEILGNAPGILSARWSGATSQTSGATSQTSEPCHSCESRNPTPNTPVNIDHANNLLLLSQLANLPEKLRKARFVTSAVLVTPTKNYSTFGEMHGSIINEMRGENGFGYDKIFVPTALLNTENAGLTTAQITPELKNQISHRGAAINDMIPNLLNLF